MITKITPVQELKQLFLEIFLNKTDKITDIAEDSVMNGVAFGAAKIGQKCLTNQAVVEGNLFPDTAYGQYLDNIAVQRGVAPRFGASGSSTYIRIFADAGTYYSTDVQFVAKNGVIFVLEEAVTVPDTGIIYAKVQSTTTGSRTNVEPLAISNIINRPTGHLNATNEYKAMFGFDVESDDFFRERIKKSANILARGTLAYLEQIFMRINPRVLRLYKNISNSGSYSLTVVPVNGVNFSTEELTQLQSFSVEFLNLSEILNPDFELELVNPTWYEVNVDFRLDIDNALNRDIIRRNLQIQFQKLLDYRHWKPTNRLEWDNLLFAAKQTEGVRYVPDNWFFPQRDENIPTNQLPRIRSFILRDLDGNVWVNDDAFMNEYYYPNNIDFNFQASVLETIEP
jgi:hypothetical protein